MSTWESIDKLIKKEIIQEGCFSRGPTDLDVCNIFVDNPQSIELTLDQIKNDLHSEIVDRAFKKKIVIGEACSNTDRFLEKAVRRMNLNEKSLITIQVPLNDTEEKTAVLSLEVTLVSVDYHKPIWKSSAEEKYKVSLAYKEKGVELFKTKRYVDAFYKFSQASKILITLEPLEDDDEPLLKDIHNLKNILYNNIAECQLIRKNYELVVPLCNKVLNREEKNVKALYRRGIAYGYLKNFEKAANDLKTVMTLQPNNKAALEKYKEFVLQWRNSVHGYEEIVRNMFRI